ncbi:TIGR03619 family F420-dependent LLM class oxidoreductase [Gordonia sp. HNM0687]|uniref:TIGR03619 family F420-dependent LLM class oxidoreductase n=1 Tax=Gordonia mangrovi TaxID=2665643 RepID=A0A6L7GXA4_9ACTN|nr:TIGR03619 family F420-dependent LLM class oxidoreductase [Gordonia mangrovi]MXP24167.1 TIGR03619 family F420-dependent LLM class oxidoreductase [Gordonia mangrovi]UVF76944.1 TIGR03619 family F420-dependent LLM class oxidoreductase [Gordonia mangrovi]
MTNTGHSEDNVIIGLHPAVTDTTMPVRDLLVAAEARRIGGFYLPEHTHLPVDRERSQYPGGGTMPDRYKRLVDPYTTLAYAAALTTGMELGTCVGLIGNHDPIALAKAIATVDMLSGGRMFLGVGFGWNNAEFVAHNSADISAKADVTQEKLELMRSLWTDDEACYQGKFVTLEPSWAWPKPSRRPAIPSLLGAPPTERTFERIATWADGWLTMGTTLASDDFPAHLISLRTTWARHGRDPDDLQIAVIEAPCKRSELAQVRDTARTLGVGRVILHVEDAPEKSLLEVMDDIAAVQSS